MVTLSFIVMALLPIVLPSVLALLGLLALCFAPSVRIVDEAPEAVAAIVVPAINVTWSPVPAATVVVDLVWSPTEACYTVAAEPTMADALFSGMDEYMCAPTLRCSLG
jgi:hypothetical protein